MILIKNGRVVDAKSNTDEVLDVVIDGGKMCIRDRYMEQAVR